MAFPSTFSAWTYRQAITLPSNSGTITDFVFTYFAAGTSSKNLPSSVWTEAKSDGSDITFGDGNTQLDSTRIKWDSVNSKYRFDIRIPSYTSAKTIYVYWGNASANLAASNTDTYRTSYKAWLPLAESSGTLYDKTSNANNGSLVSGETSTYGLTNIGNCGMLLEDNATISIANSTTLTNNTFQISMIFQKTVELPYPTSSYDLMGKQGYPNGFEIMVDLEVSTAAYSTLAGYVIDLNGDNEIDVFASSNGVLFDGNPHLITFLATGTDVRLYLDKTRVDDSVVTYGTYTTLTNCDNPLRFGNNVGRFNSGVMVGNYSQLGYMAEVFTDNERGAFVDCMINESWSAGSKETQSSVSHTPKGIYWAIF
jgi:hypothetical protein